jgi:hypothetical protein
MHASVGKAGTEPVAVLQPFQSDILGLFKAQPDIASTRVVVRSVVLDAEFLAVFGDDRRPVGNLFDFEELTVISNYL